MASYGFNGLTQHSSDNYLLSDDIDSLVRLIWAFIIDMNHENTLIAKIEKYFVCILNYTHYTLRCFDASYEILSAVGSYHIEGWDKMAAILRTTFSSAFS